MLDLLRLYMPVLFPSWRFFKEIEPSARIEYRLEDGPWRLATERRKRVCLKQMLLGVFWNPDWNEVLYLVSCAERLVVAPTTHAEREIRSRIARRKGIRGPLAFRLVFVSREAGAVLARTEFVSAPQEVGNR